MTFPESWNWKAAKVVTSEVWHGKTPGWDMEGKWGVRQPFQWFPQADIMAMGQPGTHHGDLVHDYPVLHGAQRPKAFGNMEEGEIKHLEGEPPWVDYYGDYTQPHAEQAMQQIRTVHPDAQWVPQIQKGLSNQYIGSKVAKPQIGLLWEIAALRKYIDPLKQHAIDQMLRQFGPMQTLQFLKELKPRESQEEFHPWNEDAVHSPVTSTYKQPESYEETRRRAKAIMRLAQAF